MKNIIMFLMIGFITQLSFASEVKNATNSIEEVVVTALGREVSLQGAPASVQVFTQSKIQDSGIQKVGDFISLSPGVSLVHTAEIQDTQVSIRGLNGARDSESNFALVVDGVLLTNPGAFNRELIDLQQIEVLKGPQGALYGRNAIAGAIIINTAKPDPSGYQGSTKITFGNNNSLLLQQVINTPFSDDFAAKFAFSSRKTDGFYKNTYLNKKVIDNLNDDNFLARFTGVISSDTTADFKIGFGKATGPAISFNASVQLPQASAFYSSIGSPAAPFLYEDVNLHNFDYQSNIESKNNSDNFNFSMKFDVDTGNNESFVFMLAFNDQKNKLLADGASAAFSTYFGTTSCQDTSGQVNSGLLPSFPLPFGTASTYPNVGFYPPYSVTTCDGYQYQQRDQRDITLDLRYKSDPSLDTLWTVGMSIYQINRHVIVAQGEDFGTGVPFEGFSPQTDLLFNDKYKSDVLAFYTSLNFKVDTTFDILMDLRYDQEKRSATNNVSPSFNTGLNPQGHGFLNPGLTVINTGITNSANYKSIPSKSKTFEQFQPKIGFSVHPKDNVNFYGNIGVGFRSGGFNSLGTEATINQYYCPAGKTPSPTLPITMGGASPCFTGYGVFNIPGIQLKIFNVKDEYKKEVSTSGELGLKLFLNNGDVTLDISTYKTIVDNLQFFNFLVGPYGLLRVITNIDQASINGFEFAGEFKVGSGIMLNLAYSRIKSKIDKNTNRPYTEGNLVPFAPVQSYTLGVQYKDYITKGVKIIIKGDYNFTGDTWFGEVQENNRNDEIPNQFTQYGFGFSGMEKTKRDGFGLVNARIGFEWDSGFAVTLWADNLLNTQYLAEIIPAPEFGGSFIHQGSSRSVGLEISAKY
ncbi:MAG: TonB-dependent receptor [Methylacidiphilales bacterium]|nr:TonB-dependent receptor [Candidatus Methylacidiphilales bacterium]